MDQYVAASWQVKEGSEEEFIKRWKEFTTWSLEHASGARSFTLLRSEVEPTRFISYGTWTDRAAIEAWWELPGFMERYESTQSLCVEHYGAISSVEALLTPVP
jgi:heme-degrading monooxygenase HmoA